MDDVEPEDEYDVLDEEENIEQELDDNASEMQQILLNHVKKNSIPICEYLTEESMLQFIEHTISKRSS
jgi:hypothetical protein